MSSLFESISDKPGINAQIEALLKKHDPEQQTRMLDALEALKLAGPQGLRPADWAARVKELHPDGGFNMGELLKTLAKDFQCCVRRIGDGVYAWDDSDRELGSVDPHLSAAIGGQIQLTDISMDLMKQLGEFTTEDLAAKISQRTGMPQQAAEQYAAHLIQQFLGEVITDLGGGRYRFNPDKPKTSAEHMADLRDMLRRAGMGSPD